MKVIIAGSREFYDYDKLLSVMDTVKSIDEWQIDEVVCGLAKGADSLGKRWADENDIPVAPFPANWEKFGKQSGYLRNAEMAKYADALIAFVDNKSKSKSRGTKNMISLARENKLRIIIITIR